MKNQEVFTLKEVLSGMEKMEINDVPFAMQLVDLEIAVDKEIKRLQAIVKKLANYTDGDKPLIEAREKVFRIVNSTDLSYDEKERQAKEINDSFTEEEIEVFNKKDAKVQDFLSAKYGGKLPKVPTEKLPKGLPLKSYKIFSLLNL